MQRFCTFLVLGMVIFSSSGFAQQRQRQQRPKRKAVVDEVSGQGYGTAGCGLGSIVFGDKPGMIQIVAATVNGTGGQTFAITSGTSNCDDASEGRNASKIFIETNRETLVRDLSRGSGESLASLSKLMGCADSAMLGRKLQQNFGRIYPESSVTNDQMLQSIFSTIDHDADLAGQCVISG